MNEITLQMPKSLYQNLEDLAKNEAVSLHEYILYILTRQIAQDYSVRVMPAEEVAEQKVAFDHLLNALGKASPEALDAVLEDRDEAHPEPELSPETIQKVNAMIARKMGNSD
jgi:hypothetical protein